MVEKFYNMLGFRDKKSKINVPIKCIIVSILFLFPQIISFASTSTQSCINTYLVLDVGSSTTKSTLYKKDNCANDAVVSRETFDINYPYQSCLSNGENNGVMPQKCIIEGIDVMTTIMKKFDVKCGEDTECYAFATAWARNTKNNHEWVAAVKNVKINPTIATQEYEGLLKLNAAGKAFAEMYSNQVYKGNKFLVFDIGGASFQIGWIDNKGEKQQYHGKYGTDNFTHMMQKEFMSKEQIDCIQARNIMILRSSNKEKMTKEKMREIKEAEEIIKKTCESEPLTTLINDQIDGAIEYARKFVGKSIVEDKNLQEFIKQKNPVLLGDTPLLTLGVKKQVGINKDVVTKEDLLKVIHDMAGLRYDEVAKKYPLLPPMCINTTQPSMIILYVLMESLNIDEMNIIQSDHTSQFLNEQIKKG